MAMDWPNDDKKAHKYPFISSLLILENEIPFSLPSTVMNIPVITRPMPSNPLQPMVSPRNRYAFPAVIGGDSAKKSMDTLGPTVSYAVKRKTSEITKPIIPDKDK